MRNTNRVSISNTNGVSISNKIKEAINDCDCELESQALRGCMITLMIDSDLSNEQVNLLKFWGVI